MLYEVGANSAFRLVHPVVSKKGSRLGQRTLRIPGCVLARFAWEPCTCRCCRNGDQTNEKEKRGKAQH
jgi:hypothetical protein